MTTKNTTTHTTIECPLCSSNRYIEIEKFRSKLITDFYNKHYNMDVSNYFPSNEFTTYLCADCGLRHHSPAIPGNSDYYNHMQTLDFYYEKNKPEFSYAIKKLMEIKPESLLEIGCGEGHFLAKIKNAFNVKGAELTEDSITKMKEKGIRLDQPHDLYAFVCNFQVLEHVPDVYNFIKLMVDKLKPGGHLLITVPNNDSKYCTEQFGVLDYPPHHMTQWTKQSLYHIAEIFPLETIEYYEEPHRLTHYQGLIKGRRQQLLTSKGFKGKIMKALALVLDPVMSPYMLDHIDYCGMTHGMLFKKKI